MSIFIRTMVAIAFMALLWCPPLQADEGFDFTKEEETEGFDFTKDEEEPEGFDFSKEQDQKEAEYLQKLEELLSEFNQVIAKEGVTPAAAEKMRQLRARLQDLLEPATWTNKLEKHPRKAQPLTADKIFQSALKGYAFHILHLITFIDQSSGSNLMLQRMIELCDGNTTKELVRELQRLTEGVMEMHEDLRGGRGPKIVDDLVSQARDADSGYWKINFIQKIIGYDHLVDALAKDSYYLVRGELSAGTANKIYFVDSLRHIMIHEKSNCLKVKSAFESIAADWADLSGWHYERHEVIPQGVWKEASKKIGHSISAIQYSLLEVNKAYADNYKTCMDGGHIYKLLSLGSTERDLYLKNMNGVWKSLREEVDSLFLLYENKLKAKHGGR